jgi:enoyl-CoA hydratase/carnithine racemase
VTRFEDYRDRFERIELERTDGVLTMRFHTEGGPLRWSVSAHHEFGVAFGEIAHDPDNLIVIMTGAGAEFSGPAATFGAPDQLGTMSVSEFDTLRSEGKDLLNNLLRIEAPMIAAVNGPALRHAELPLLCDIVLAADTATFQDTAHFTNHAPPGDGQHVILPLAMGINRARYFLLTGQAIPAEEAKQFGLVNEVLAPDQLLPRAHELAAIMLRQPPAVLKYSRLILTQLIKREMHDFLEYGLTLEGLGIVG